MHPRVSLHQVAMVDRETGPFLQFCCEIGVQHATLVSPRLLQASELRAAREAVQHGTIRVGCINHPFALQPDLERHTESAADGLMQVIDMAAELGAPSIYLITGGRGALSWEQAAERFTDLIDPCREHAARQGVALLVENASPLTVDIHIAHTLPDALRIPKPLIDEAIGALREQGTAAAGVLGDIPRDRDVLVYCQSGMRSAAVIRALATAGYDPGRLFNLEKGFSAWTGPKA